MFLKKKIITAALVAALGFSVFAQTSNTNASTAGLFGTDVDAYMNVNYWSTVEPENMFAYAGFSYGTPYLGFAKDFGAFYWGTYFTGNFGDTDNTTVVTGDNTSINNYYGFNDSSSFTFYNLFGFGNIGIKILFDYSDPKSKKEKTGTTTETVDAKRIGLGVRAGLADFELAGKTLIPYAQFFMRSAYDGSKTVIDDGTTTTTTDGRRTYLTIIAGSDIILSETDTLKQSVETWVRFSNYSYKDKEAFAIVNGNPVQQKYIKTSYLTIPVWYTAKFNATDKLSFAVKAGSTNQLTMNQTQEKVKETQFTINPDLSAGLTYDTGKKVVLNAGVTLNTLLPTITFTTKTDSTNDPATKTKTTTLSSTSGSLSFSSGFAIKPTQNLTIDCTYSILSHILGNDFNGNLLDGASHSIWETLNDTFVYNIGFEISYKF